MACHDKNVIHDSTIQKKKNDDDVARYSMSYIKLGPHISIS